jgi:uncharacterized membrane protein YfcA
MEVSALTFVYGALIGLILAFTGAGGGVLSIPLLVFGLGLTVSQAAPVGLIAVGAAAAVGAALGLREGIVRYRAAAVVGASGMLVSPLGVWLAQRLPNQPLLAAFALILLFSAWRSLRRVPERGARSVRCMVSEQDHRLRWTWPCAAAMSGTGMLTGVLSGLLGVGGGFVIVPSLLWHTDLDIRSIQVTSLAVIALVSASGVLAATAQGAMAWQVAMPFAAGAVLALLMGRMISKRVQSHRLQQAFATVCVVVAGLMLARAGGFWG